jgi:hypothetical protein
MVMIFTTLIGRQVGIRVIFAVLRQSVLEALMNIFCKAFKLSSR